MIWKECKEKPMDMQRLPGVGHRAREERRRMKMMRERKMVGTR